MVCYSEIRLPYHIYQSDSEVKGHKVESCTLIKWGVSVDHPEGT